MILEFSKWPTAAILIFEKASMEKTRDSSNFDSGHIQVAFLKFSVFYIFFHFFTEKNLMLLGYRANIIIIHISSNIKFILDAGSDELTVSNV